MTMELLSRIIAENHVPKDVRFMSDSGWECDPTEMDGDFYNRSQNIMIFTQNASGGEYEQSDEWEILYAPDLIKFKQLAVYPAVNVMGFGATEAFKKALKAAGEFERKKII